jgi:hypothetical protein
VVSRVCLDLLRARKSRREEPLETHVPDPVVRGPEAAAEQADAVSLARVGRSARGRRRPPDWVTSLPAIRDGRIVEISIVADPDRLAGLDLRGVL